MSLELSMGTKPEGVTAMTRGAKGVRVGTLEISMEDFCQLAVYVLTSSDLEHGDPRIHFMLQLAKLNTVPGHNPGGYRLG